MSEKDREQLNKFQDEIDELHNKLDKLDRKINKKLNAINIHLKKMDTKAEYYRIFTLMMLFFGVFALAFALAQSYNILPMNGFLIELFIAALSLFGLVVAVGLLRRLFRLMKEGKDTELDRELWGSVR